MPKVSKKWLFLLVSFFAIQHPVAVSAMELQKSKSHFGYVGHGVKYLVDTVKSDLSIGGNIVQHNTVASQLGAAARLDLYNRILTFVGGMAVWAILKKILPEEVRWAEAQEKADAERQKSRPKLTNFKMSEIRPYIKTLLRLSFTTPIKEELIYTYFPQFLNRLLKKYAFETYNIPLIVASTRFGLGHGCPLFVSAGLFNYFNHRYLLGRSIVSNPNLVPLLAHCLHSIAISANAIYRGDARYIKYCA